MRDLNQEELQEYNLTGRWRRVKGYEEQYLVSEAGEVYSIRSAKKLKPAKDSGGYLYLNLCVNGKVKKKKVHRLVAEAFIFNLENYPCVNHLDSVRTNNDVNNLEWCTYSQNNKHAYKVGFKKPTRGSKAGNSKLTETDVLEIVELLSQGYIQKDIAKKFSVSPPTIRDIKTGRRWSSVTNIKYKSKIS